MYYIALDTETTGIPKKGELIQPGQARVCQLAFLFFDEEGKSIAEFSHFIEPDGWSICQAASDATGITDDMCYEFGIPMRDAYNMYHHYTRLASTIIAHNIGFDKRLMEIEAAYQSCPHLKIPWFCTMKETKDIAKAPLTAKQLACNFTGYKNPKLEESLLALCGRELGDDAHDAMFDVRACQEIFFALQARKAA